MASLDVLPAQNKGTLESFCSSEFSIIPEEPEEVVFHYSTNSTDLQTDLLSARFELSEEEQDIQMRLFQLVEDNRTLRETLQQRNAALRSELSSIAAWHDNITTNMAALKVRIQELEQEKEELLKKNKREDKEGQAVKNSVASEEDSSEYVIIQDKSKDPESLESQLNEAKLNIEELKHKIEEQNSKIETMQNMYEESEKEKYDLLKSNLATQEELNLRNEELLLNQAEGYQEKNIAMQKEHGMIVAKLQEQIESLEEELASVKRAVENGKIKNLADKILLRNLQSDNDNVTKRLQMKLRKEKQEIEKIHEESEKEKNDLKSKLASLEALNSRNDELLQNQAKEPNAMQEEHGRVVAMLQEQIKSLEEELAAKKRVVEALKKEKQEVPEDRQNVATMCRLCNKHAKHLSSRHPHLRDEIHRHLNLLNNKWQASHFGHQGHTSKDALFHEIASRMKSLRNWLREVEGRPSPVPSASSPNTLKDKHSKQTTLQKEIEEKGRCVHSLRRACARLEGSAPLGASSLAQWDAERVCRVAKNLEYRWHALWLASLERQCALEEGIRNATDERRNKEQIDSLTARLLDCKQRLEESEVQVSEARDSLSMAQFSYDHHAYRPRVLDPEAHHSECFRLMEQVIERESDLEKAILAKETAQEEVSQAQEQLEKLRLAQAAASFSSSNCGAGSVHGGQGKRTVENGSESGGIPLHPPSASRS